MIGLPNPEERVQSFAQDINTVVDYTSSRIEELEKRVAKDEAFREWMRLVETDGWFNAYPMAVRLFVGNRGYGPWYQREAWDHVKNWAYTQNALNVFDYLYDRYPRVVIR